MRIGDFIDGEYKEYASYDNKRSLPNLVDGLKTSQRKAIAAAIKHKEQIKVSGLAAKAIDEYNYAHGDASLQNTIVNMAKDYVGSNNVNLLDPIGSFGNILKWDSASPRYIQTKLSKNFGLYFNEDDNDIVEYEYSEGQRVEPSFYYPILPMILINGSEGIGNGFSCTIFSYSEESIKQCINEYIQSKTITSKLIPYVKGYKGEIVKNNVTNQIVMYGAFKRINTTTIQITEVPISYDHDKYKDVLNGLVDSKEIKDYESYSTGEAWNFTLDVTRAFSSLSDIEILEKLKLVYKLTETITAWNDKKKLITYKCVEDLLIDWIEVRSKAYELRKNNILQKYEKELIEAKTKMQFIVLWNKNSNEWHKLKKKELIEVLSVEMPGCESQFDKLLSLPVTSLGIESVTVLEKRIKELEKGISKTSKMKVIDFMKLDLG